MADGGNGRCAGGDAASVDVSRGSTRVVSATEGAGGATGGGGTSPEGQSEALMALDVSLAHNELRAMLDAVYGEMDALRHQVQALREENARLEEEVGRRQEELARAADVRGNDATCLERELLDAKQQHQTLSARHDAQEAECARLEAAVEARDQTIAEMKKLVEETAAKRKTGEAAGSAFLVSEDELERVVGDFSRREQHVYGNLDYVRKASGGLQVTTSELAMHISELRREMAQLQQQQAGYKAHIENHRCNAASTNRNVTQDAAPSRVEAVEPRLPDEHCNGLEHRITTLELERDALRLRCQSLEADIEAIQKQLADTALTNAASRDLIAKYEESAREGTQTIDGLQESLLVICAQLEEERDRHRRALQEATSLFGVKAKELQAEIARLHNQLSSMETTDSEKETASAIEIARSDLRAALDAERVRVGVPSPIAGESGFPLRRSSLQVAPVPASTVLGWSSPHVRSGTTLLAGDTSPHPRPSSLHRTPATNSKRPRSQNVEEIDDSDIGEGILATIAETARRNVTSKSSASSKRAPPLDPKAPCAGCRGKSFGFMVRCHKCKGQFHISCTQSTKEATKGKRKMRHAFQCAKCTSALQQRPSKVSRKSNTPSAA